MASPAEEKLGPSVIFARGPIREFGRHCVLVKTKTYTQFFLSDLQLTSSDSVTEHRRQSSIIAF